MTSPIPRLSNSLDRLQGVLLITKHLDVLLPLLLSLERIRADNPKRFGLLQSIAVELANNHEAVVDCYDALELITGEDLSGRSVTDLLQAAIDNLSEGGLVDIWRTAFHLELIDEAALQRWVIYEELTDANSGSGRSRKFD